MSEVIGVLLLILLVLAIPVISIVALVMALNARDGVRQLQRRIAALEARPASPPSVAPTAESVPAAPVQPAEPPPRIVEPAAAPETPEPVASVPTTPAPAHATLEERFGTQWVVWIGGLALALGGVFLVRYSIEQGWIGPGVRIMLGGLLATALVAAGEWTRRNEIRTGFADIPTAHIPGILTAAGTTVAYATVYAAYALYGFLPPGAAFVLLGLVALATLAAALLHGPALAGLGLVGAYVTPLLVASEEPNFWALYLYLAVVTAAAFALARARLWRWLAITAVLFSACWILPGLADAATHSAPPHVFYAIVVFALSAALIVSGLAFGPDAVPDTIDGVSSMALIAFLIAAALVVMASGHDMLALFGFAVLVAA